MKNSHLLIIKVFITILNVLTVSIVALGEIENLPAPNKFNSTKTLVFSGLTWTVRNGTGNPGGNNWSDSSESVWVDNDGRLHLKIRQIDGKWHCSEIYTKVAMGYGEYRFYIGSDVETLDKNVVAGLFTYLNDHNEIDIEFSKWGVATQKKVGNYVIQPSNKAGNKNNFNLNLAGNLSTHRFIWRPNSINFKSWQGNSDRSTADTQIAEWNYFGEDIPVPGGENLILNLWLYKGIRPDDGKEVEIIIDSVRVKKLPDISDLTISVPENAAVFDILGKLNILGYKNNELNYSIIEGNNSGLFSVSENGEIVLEKQPDSETSPFEKFTVVASTGDLTDTAYVKVEIINVTETGINNARPVSGICIFPNPAKNTLNIHCNPGCGFEYQVVELDGKIVPVKETARNGHELTLNIEELNPGTYLVIIKLPAKTEIFKFSKN